MTELTVCCWLWYDVARQRSYDFAREDIKVWDNMVARHLTIPHRRVCITHRPDLVDDFIETVPIDPTKHVPGSCLVKLMTWRPDIANILGERIAQMDVDCVITGSLDPLFDCQDEVKFWKNPNYQEGGRRGFYQGSLQLLTAGARPHLWGDFDPRRTTGMLNRRFGGAEQAWISERLNTSWPEPGWEWKEPYWTEADGVYGAGRLVAGKMGEGVQSDLPENARIVFFPGDRSPSQPEVRAIHPWIEEHWN